jgi:hypothetical protein
LLGDIKAEATASALLLKLLGLLTDRIHIDSGPDIAAAMADAAARKLPPRDWNIVDVTPASGTDPEEALHRGLSAGSVRES